MQDPAIAQLEAELQAPQSAPLPVSGERVGVPASAAFASSIGNQAMTRVAGRMTTNDGEPRPSGPGGVALQRALLLARRTAPSAVPLLSRALQMSEENPGAAYPQIEAPTTSMPKCACGGTVLPGGECSGCMARRLTRQGMPQREAQRVVLARMKLARQQAGQRSFYGCLNANLSSAGLPWALVTVVALACSLVGAIGGILAAAPTGETAAPATVPMGMMIGAAVCIAGLTGFSVGLVLGMITGCVKDRNHQSIVTETASAEPGAGGGEGAEAAAPAAVA